MPLTEMNAPARAAPSFAGVGYEAALELTVEAVKKRSNPIQRMFRDAHTLGGHISFSTDAQFTTWGLAALGREIANPTL